jgi:hypothetical protein
MKMTAGGSTQSDIDAILAKVEHMVCGLLHGCYVSVTQTKWTEVPHV